MKTAIDATGRVLIPKKLRAIAALLPGTELEATFEDGRIVLEHRPLTVKLTRRGKFLVARPDDEVPPMSADLVDRELEKLRSNRGGD